MSDTIENFVSLPTENQQFDARLISTGHEFQGKKLFPFSKGVEGLMPEAIGSARGDALYALTFLKVLSKMQEEFDAFRKEQPGRGEDDATMYAIASLLRQVHGDLAMFQADVLMWKGRLTRKDLQEAIMLVNKITDEAKKSEPMAAEPDTSPGK